MGFWFGIFDKGTPWRKTPAKINDSWYTPSGGKVHSPSRYFAAVEVRNRFLLNHAV